MSNDPVAFDDAYLIDDRPPYTLDDAFEICTAMAWITGYSGRDSMDDGFDNIDDWSTLAGSWSATGGKAQGIGPGGSAWGQLRWDTDVDGTFVIELDKFDARGGICFKGTDGSQECLVAFWAATGTGFGVIDASGAGTNLFVYPATWSGASRVTLAVREIQHESDEEPDQLSMTLYFDGQLACGHVITIASHNLGDEVGLAVYDEDTITFDNAQIKQMTRIVDYVTVDPSETPGAGLVRAIASTRVKYFTRYDGTVKAWIPVTESSVMTINLSETLERSEAKNRRAALSHVRVVGALVEADAWDWDEGKIHGHCFAVVHDPNLMTVSECHDEALRILRDAKGLRQPVSLQCPAIVLLEPEDVVTFNSESITVASINFARMAGTFMCGVDARKYFGA